MRISWILGHVAAAIEDAIGWTAARHIERAIEAAGAGKRVLPDAANLWIGEKHQDGISDIFVDRRAVIRRNPRHFCLVVIEELGVGGLGAGHANTSAI